MRKQLGLVFAASGIVLLGCSCALTPMGALYTDVTSPAALGHQTSYQVTPESDYESIAFVEGTAKGTAVLGLIAVGNFGYGAAIEDALSKAPGATRLIDITVDTQIKSYFGVYSSFITKVRGRAVRMKKK